MLVRDAGDDWLLITQGDHARLAADLAEAVAEPPALPGGIVWADVVDAIRHHDDGWFERDARPVWDPDRRRVRNFDEYSLPEATAIWRDSVRRVHALATQPVEWFDRRIDRRLYEWVWCALSAASSPLTWEELAARYIEQVGPPVPEAGLREVVDAMCAAGIALREDFRLALNPWHRPRASLAALWVSSHFDVLAELAEARHANDLAQVAAARVFRADHRRWCEAAETACAGLVPPEEFAELAEIGFRAVQLFDRLSLELCRQTSPFRLEVAVPGWPRLELRIEGESFGLAPGVLSPLPTTFEAGALRIPMSAEDSAESWDAAVHASGRQLQCWTVIPS